MQAIMGLLGLALAFSDVAAAQNLRLVVPTESGLVQGVIEGNIRIFRGIPFAAPPVGDLRWRPPAARSAEWNGIRDASTFGNVCTQIDFSGNLVGNEDCLVLNVYTAANLDARAEQPVMVFFHGGGDFEGSTQDVPQGSAPPLATHDVIVVTAEYRLGALGFFVHPLLAIEGDGSSGNYGLMDQIAALAWVQRNIRNFGGDPERVMAFGQSSGAADVQALLASPAAHGLYSRVGIESDAIGANEVASPWKLRRRTRHRSSGSWGATARRTCWRACAVRRRRCWSRNQLAVPIDFVIEPRVLPEDPFAVLQRDGSPVPLLIGSTREEATGVTFFGDLTQPIDVAQYDADIHAQFDIFGLKVADQVLALYPVSAYDAPNWALVAVDSDFDLNICLVRNVARAALGRDQNSRFRQDMEKRLSWELRAPVWRYLFTHRVENDPNLNILRAFHTEELYFLFGHLDQLSQFDGAPAPDQPSADELQLSNLVMDYWTRFAATGDPNGPGAPHWPRYSAHDRILQLDVTPTRLAGYHNPQCDFFTPILNTVCQTVGCPIP